MSACTHPPFTSLHQASNKHRPLQTGAKRQRGSLPAAFFHDLWILKAKHDSINLSHVPENFTLQLLRFHLERDSVVEVVTISNEITLRGKKQETKKKCILEILR